MSYLIYGAALVLFAWLMSQHLKDGRKAQEEENRLTLPLDQFIAAYRAEHPDEQPH